ncbi:MAG TPA: PAS domain-containing sensor histidine kinase [Albitalea sp.]|jgi:PAS domain S-box-containing protein|nr:PAS domain-containing sensor histidine kinase [Albitalea sp.]
MQTQTVRAHAEPAPGGVPSLADTAALDDDQRLRWITDAAPVMLWMAGPDKRLEWFNRPWLEFTGRTLEQERGAGWLDGVHIEDLERCAGIYQASFDARQRFSMDLRVRHHDGGHRWIMVTGVPRHGAGGDFLGYTGSCVDIDERKGLEERLAERTRGLRLADRRKDEFLAMLAHDLRNPLGPITNAVALLRVMEEQTPTLAPVREIIHRQLEQLTHVIADMRDVTRVTQAKIELKKDTLPLATLVDLAVEAAQPTLDGRGHRLRVELPDEPLSVWGDAQRLSQALSHLLCNAAKFTPMPGVVVLRAQRRDGMLQIHVVDRGQGIHPDFLPHVFEPFAQESHSTPRTHNGLGVGLTIAKRLVQLHGGDVTGSSDGPGLGAEFVLSLPLPTP